MLYMQPDLRLTLASGTIFHGEFFFPLLIQVEQVVDTGKRMGAKSGELPVRGLPRNNVVK